MEKSSGELRLGIIGLGLMGSGHANRVMRGEVPGVRLAAVCDLNSDLQAEYPAARWFTSAADLLESGIAEAVVIATPHSSHVELGVAALRAGLHVLVEKPLAMHVAAARELVAAHRDGGEQFGVVFNQRTDPRYQQARAWIQDGEIGDIQRVHWIITDWFRTNAYYRHGGWRATWAGEGGGVLLNQCPHNLDLLCWVCGPVARVRAFCSLGKYHPIEVEDEVTAYLEYPNGATGVFITSTGEAPGTNRLEITGDRGRIIIEGDRVEITRNAQSAREFRASSGEKFAAPEHASEVLEFPERGTQHTGILRNFAAAIRGDEALIAPGGEGIASLELANAMLLSSFEDRAVELPLDGARYAAHLRKLIEQSKFR